MTSAGREAMPEFEVEAPAAASVAERLAAAEAARRPQEPAAAPATSETGPPASPRPAPRERLLGALRSPWPAFGVGAAAVLAVVLGVPGIQQAQAAAEVDAVASLVDDYLDAIADGDATTANALAPPDEDVASTALLADAVLGAIEQPEIAAGEPQVDGDEAVVPVSLTVDEYERTIEIAMRLERIDGTWRIASGLLMQATLQNATLTASVEGVPADALESHGGALWAYPGGYASRALESELVSAFDDAITWVFEGSATTWLGPAVAPSPLLEDTAMQHAAEFAEACAADWAPGCPVSTQGIGPATFEASLLQQSWLSGGEYVADVTVQREDAGGLVLHLQVRVPVEEEAPFEHVIIWSQEEDSGVTVVSEP